MDLPQDRTSMKVTSKKAEYTVEQSKGWLKALTDYREECNTQRFV